jgi:hypothetical protein
MNTEVTRSDIQITQAQYTTIVHQEKCIEVVKVPFAKITVICQEIL